jgi:hypothetical protein
MRSTGTRHRSAGRAPARTATGVPWTTGRTGRGPRAGAYGERAGPWSRRDARRTGPWPGAHHRRSRVGRGFAEKSPVAGSYREEFRGSARDEGSRPVRNGGGVRRRGNRRSMSGARDEVRRSAHTAKSGGRRARRGDRDREGSAGPPASPLRGPTASPSGARRQLHRDLPAPPHPAPHPPPGASPSATGLIGLSDPWHLRSQRWRAAMPSYVFGQKASPRERLPRRGVRATTDRDHPCSAPHDPPAPSADSR